MPVENFVSKYNLYEHDEVQQIQLQHRLDLVKAFEVKEGMHVLEIGCGQGDTTMALADAVGKDGRVVGLDIASRDYGTPLNLGQATDIIKKSALGERITFHFETDLNTYEADEVFDLAVLSHSSWYFKSPNDLLSYFKKLRKIAKRVCFAEWDLEFTEITQRAHFCAVSIAALYSNFVNNDGNIQNLFHKVQIKELLEEAKFEVEKEHIINAKYLQDAHWEIGYANSIRQEFINTPPMIQTLVKSYYELMNRSGGNNESLNSFVLCAK